MKKFLYITFLFFVNSIVAQEELVDYCYEPNSINEYQNKYFKDLNNNFLPFLGTWKFIEGNKTFVVTLWKVEHVSFNNVITGTFKDQIFGDWEMIQNEGLPNEIVLYKSNQHISNGNYYPPMITGGGSCDGLHFVSLILDNCIAGNNFKNGILEFTLTSSNTAHWFIKPLKGMQIENSINFKIPTNIILTKVD